MNSDAIYDVLRQMEKTPSRNAKETFLKQYGPYMRLPLYYAYHPHMKFYMKNAGIGHGWNTLDATTWMLLDRLAARTLSGNQASTIVTNHVRKLSPKSASLFNCILKKDLRCGVSAATINKALPELIPVYAVMKAEDWNPDRVVFPCYASAKVNGVRGEYREGKILSSGGRVYKGLDHIVADTKKAGLMQGLDGELLIPGKSFEESSGKIRSNNKTPGAVFLAFDMPGSSMPFHQRYKSMVAQIAEAGVTSVSVISHTIVRNMEELDAYYEYCLKLKMEGVVIKTRDYMYERRRSWNWIKRMPLYPKDVKVLDVYEGTGKYENMLGGLVVAYEGKAVKVGTGISDFQRTAWWDNKTRIIGKTVAVAFKEKTKYKSMRHSRLIRVRKDK